MKGFIKKLFGKQKEERTNLPSQNRQISFQVQQKPKVVEQSKTIVFQTQKMTLPHYKVSLPGERVELMMRALYQMNRGSPFQNVVVVITNYKMQLVGRRGQNLGGIIPDKYIIPLSCILKFPVTEENKKSKFEIVIRTKQARMFKLIFDREQEPNLQRVDQILNPSKEDSIAFMHNLSIKSRMTPFNFMAEVERQQVPLSDKFFHVVSNQKGVICPTYGENLVLPVQLTYDQIIACAKFRSKQRLPCLTYFNKQFKTSIYRCSQGVIGISGRRQPKDQKMLKLIGDMSSRIQKEYRESKNCHIYDARSFTAALGNRVAGKGYQQEIYYTNCQIYFLNIQNIHVVRESYIKMVDATYKQEGFYKAVADSGWLNMVALILLGAKRIVQSLRSKASVVVHCSDGWDRTSQLCSLAQLMIDPFYRTFAGFETLVRKDWLYFGHMFNTRNGTNPSEKDEQRSPVFTQFLDCVHQLLNSFPTAFQFNLYYITYLQYHSRSGRFGQFLFDCEIQRTKESELQSYASIWDRLKQKADKFRNVFYRPQYHQVLDYTPIPCQLRIWNQLFFYRDQSFRDDYKIFDVKFLQENLHKLQEQTLQKSQAILNSKT